MNDGVMIAFLPTDGGFVRQDLPHMTLVYCGTTTDLSPTDLSELAKTTLSIARVTKPFDLKVSGLEVFGDEEKVDVLTLFPIPELLTARSLCAAWDASERPFNPHVTIGPEGSASRMLPTHLYFNRICLSWGERLLEFSLYDSPYDSPTMARDY